MSDENHKMRALGKSILFSLLVFSFVFALFFGQQRISQLESEAFAALDSVRNVEKSIMYESKDYIDEIKKLENLDNGTKEVIAEFTEHGKAHSSASNPKEHLESATMFIEGFNKFKEKVKIENPELLKNDNINKLAKMYNEHEVKLIENKNNYNRKAKKYNRRLNRSLSGILSKMIGFEELELIDVERT